MTLPEADARSRRRILVVDDDASIRSFVQQALGDAGYEVALAANGEQALESVDAAAPHLILLDVRMPGVDGWQVLDALRSAAGDQTPVVVMTAEYSGQERALASGAQGYLAKPFELDDLLDCVDLHSSLRLDVTMQEAPAVRET
jgi:CheY-like chemotaxis protein